MAQTDNIKVETNGPKNGPANVKQEAKKPDAPVKFQGGGGGGQNNQHFNHRGPRGGGNRGGFRNNQGRGFKQGGPPRNQGQQQSNQQSQGKTAELMSVDTGNVGEKQGGGGYQGGQGGGYQGGQGGGYQGGQRRGPFQRNHERNNPEDRFADRIATISGPTVDLPPIDNTEKKFAGRCRLYIGNLTNDVTVEEMEQLFAPFGETSEPFLNAEKMFGFIRLDFRANAEKAKRELDGQLRKGRNLRVRFAPHSAAIKIKNLNQFVTNELLEWAFQVFGEIERAVVIADERGKTTGEGIVEFARKPAAMQALRRCTENCYFVTGSLRPVIVEPYEFLDDTDGYSEKSIFKKGPEFFKEREVGPRFASPGSFEADYGQRWKALAELHKQKEEALKRELKLDEEKLEAQMEYARYEHETDMLRAQLRQREQDKDRQKREWELKEKAAEEARRAEQELIRRSADEMTLRLKRQQEEDDSLRRRQNESSLLMQAQQLTSLLEQQEQVLGAAFTSRPPGASALQSDPKAFLDSFDGRRGGQSRPDNRGPRWGGPQERRGAPGPEDYQNKRRRF